MILRHLGIAALFLLVIGIVTQIPLPGTVATGQRTFQQAMAEHKELQRAERAESGNAPPSDPKQHAMYQEVVDAAEQVEGFPCSAKNRHRLAEAVAVLGNFDRDNYHKLESATEMENGHPAAVGDPLAEKAYFITRDAMLDGVVHRTVSGVYEVPDPYAPVSPKWQFTGDNARFICEHPS
jgi:hypothetical protein